MGRNAFLNNFQPSLRDSISNAALRVHQSAWGSSGLSLDLEPDDCARTCPMRYMTTLLV